MSVDDEILGYLSRHPAAKDTLEGIVVWWIPANALERAKAEVSTALQRLVAGKRLVAQRGSDGQIRYCAPTSADLKRPGTNNNSNEQ